MEFRNNNGYKLSKLEKIESIESSGKALNDDSLFLVSDTEDGSTYVSKSLRYSDLVASVATTLEDNGGGGSGGGCLFSGIDLPGKEYPIQNMYSAFQTLTATSIDFKQTTNTEGIWFNEANTLTVPTTLTSAVNVHFVLSAYATLINQVSPGAGIYVLQKDQSGNNIRVPIIDDQVDAKGWVTVIGNFLAWPGTVFGGYVYNPLIKNGKLCAFYQAPSTGGNAGEDPGQDYKILFNSSNLRTSLENSSLTGWAEYYTIKSSLALASAGTVMLEGKIGGTWVGISKYSVSTNAGAGSANTKLRLHNAIQIPAGTTLRARSTQNVDLSKFVTNQNAGTIYMFKLNNTITPSSVKDNGIACKFAGAGITDTLNFALNGTGPLDVGWRQETTSLATLAERYNYTTKKAHDGQYNTSLTSNHIWHEYTTSETGEHLAIFGGTSQTSRILNFSIYSNGHRNKMTELSCFSPTSLSASCLKNLTSLRRVYSDTGKISSLQNYCLAGCTSLTSLELTCDPILTINTGCLSNDTALKNVKIVANTYVLNAFGDGFAANCTALTSVTLPKFNNRIGDVTASQAPFNGCSSLSTLTLSATNSGYIGGRIAQNCTSLTSFALEGGCKVNSAPFDTATMNSIKQLALNFSTPGQLSSAIISGSSSLTSVVLGNATVKTAKAFQANSALKTITLSGDISAIAGSTFLNCPELTSVNLAGVTPSKITNSFFGTKCFAGTTSKDISMYFPKEDVMSVDAIKTALLANTKANAIIYCDNNVKGTIVERKAVIYQSGKSKSIGTLTFKNEKKSSGTNAYTLEFA